MVFLEAKIQAKYLPCVSQYLNQKEKLIKKQEKKVKDCYINMEVHIPSVFFFLCFSHNIKEKVQNVLVTFQSKLILFYNWCFVCSSSCLLIHDTRVQ